MSTEEIIERITELVKCGKIQSAHKFVFRNECLNRVSASDFRFCGDSMYFRYENYHTGDVNEEADLDNYIISFIHRLWDCIRKELLTDHNLF